jgi:xanthine/CO dehydrogenase XdhC/CoxF family maturation factor
MIELERICREATALRARGAPFLLATVARVSGSAYRRPGARMLIADDQWVAGSVSGGCLERDVLVRGAFRTRAGAPVVVRYDSTSDDDLAWGMGLGCNGVVDVLLERIDESTMLDPTAFATACFADEANGALVTVIASDDAAIPVGARVIAREGLLHATVPPGPLRDVLSRAASAALAMGAERVRQLAHGGVVALVERITPPPHLFVIGTRHDALPLVTLAREIGLRVTVADRSPSTSTRARFACADHLVFGSPHAIARAIDHRACPVVVVMTHDYEQDSEFLLAALATRAIYVGVLGPRERTKRMLGEAGMQLVGEVAGRLHSPVGLDLGAETPHEIALAILAEVQATLARATARPLRERRGTIHDARATSVLA